MFDCVLPTRIARNGTAFTAKGTFNVKAGFNKSDFRPIEEGCECYACKHFTRAYLRRMVEHAHDADYLTQPIDRYIEQGVRDGTVTLWWAYRDAHKENLGKVASVWKDRALPDFGREP